VTPQLLVLQHIACEPPAAYEVELRRREIDLVRVEVDDGEEIPDWRDFAGIVAMGGPMGAYEDEEHPWLVAEKKLIAEAARSNRPFWGVCLGAQLLAASLGASVYPGGQPEVGIETVRLAEAGNADPVFSETPPEFSVLQWHSDTFDLPAGATLLATGELYRNQAFVWRRAYGLQFHLEVGAELAATWADVPAYAEALERLNGPGALERLVGELEAKTSEIIPLAHHLFGRWLEEVVGAGGEEPSEYPLSQEGGVLSRP
jgi:GMP synthase (glutamine-hydrolysing)